MDRSPVGEESESYWDRLLRLKQNNYFGESSPAIEFSERLSYFGIVTSLIIYLTKAMHQDLKTAAKNVNYWIGFTTIMPLLGGFLADAYLGRFSTVLASSILYLLSSVNDVFKA